MVVGFGELPVAYVLAYCEYGCFVKARPSTSSRRYPCVSLPDDEAGPAVSPGSQVEKAYSTIERNSQKIGRGKKMREKARDLQGERNLQQRVLFKREV